MLRAARSSALVMDVASRATRAEATEPVRIAGMVLQGAIHDLLSLLGGWFLDMPNELDDERLMRALADDHFRKELRTA